MLVVFIRTVILYIVVLVTVRIMGKSELSKLSPFQLVIIFMIAELASIPIETPGASAITGITGIAALLFLQVLISYISIKSEWFKNFVNGKPSVLIDHGRINERELKSLRISINDLMEQLRLGNAPSITDVDYAIMESNGNLSIILKPEKRPVTLTDMNLIPGYAAMPAVILSDGFLYKSNLKAMGYDERYLKKLLNKYKIKSYDEVFMVFGDENCQLHIYVKAQNGYIEEVTP